MGVLREYHAAMGAPDPRPRGHARALHRGRDDGLLQRPRAGSRRAGAAVRMAVAMRDRVGIWRRWRKRGHELDFGIGIAQGTPRSAPSASRGAWTTAPSGRSPNLAARLCGEAKAGQILVAQRVASAVEDLADLEEVGSAHAQGTAPARSHVQRNRAEGVKGHTPSPCPLPGGERELSGRWSGARGRSCPRRPRGGPPRSGRRGTGVRSTVRGLPSRIHSARHLPIAGEVLNDVPESPSIT